MVASVWFSALISTCSLGLDGLVHALVVAPARQHAAGELVDDDDLAVADDVVRSRWNSSLALTALFR